MTERIWEKLNNLSEDAQNAAISKAKELGFDLNKGAIPIDECFINLNADVATLRDAIEKKKLAQIPLSFQKGLFESLDNISKFLTGLASGTDDIVNLVEAIEALHATIWQLGFQKLSDEYLGYQTKLNQVKFLEVELRKLMSQLEAGIAVKESLDRLIDDARKNKESLDATLVAATTAYETSNTFLAKVVDVDQKSSALLTKIQQDERTSSEQLSKTTTSSSDVAAVEVKIKEFYKEVDEYRTHITKVSETAKTVVGENDTKTKFLIAELDRLEGQIRDQIRRATGHSLFHSFQTRQEALAKTKMFWVWAIALIVALSAGFSIYLAHSTEAFDKVFYLKLSLTIPLAFAIVFCTVQYSRERRLEEEYAFKSNISISLVPYQELVEKLVDKAQQTERERFAAFMIDSVTKVFTSPTDKVFETHQKDSDELDKSVKRLMSIVKPVIKGLKH